MKKLFITLSIGEKYLREYNDLFAPSQKAYAKKFDYDFKVIDDFLYKKIPHHDTISFNKILAFSQEWSKQYDYIAFVDADIFINPDSPDLIDALRDKEKVGVIDEYSQPTRESRILVQKKMGWETSAQEYYKLAGFNLETNSMVNTGVILANPKLHADMFKSIHYKHVLTSIGHYRHFHFEQSAIGYQLQKNELCEFMDNKFNAVWAIHKINNPSLEISQFAKQNYFTHLAGKIDFDKIPDLNKKFGFK